MDSKCDPHLVAMLSDAYRFILAHAEQIAASALDVYYSALPFVPKDALLYETYSHEEDKSISVLQGRESTWPHCLITLEGHSACVDSVAFSPDGMRLAPGSADCMVRLWDVVSGANTATLQGHRSSANSVVPSPDGLLLASGSDSTVQLWDVVSGTTTATLEGHSSAVHSIVFSPDGQLLVSGSRDAALWLWDVISGSSTAMLQGRERFLRRLLPGRAATGVGLIR